MVYKIKRLPSFDKSAFDADASLYALSPSTADKFYADYCNKIELIKKNPMMYQVFEDDPYFRSAGLAYGYRLFYHVEESSRLVVLHRVLYGAMDLTKRLQGDVKL